MRSIWVFLTKNLDLVLKSSAIPLKYFSPVKEVKYLAGRK